MHYSILIVDDEYYICEGLKIKIQNLSIPHITEIQTCYSGEEALKICKNYKPHIVLTDIKMDDIDGISLIHQLKSQLHPVRFLVFSGYDDYEYVRNSFQEGAVDYLLKPVLSEQLDKILREQCASLDQIYIGDISSRSSSIELFENFLKALQWREGRQEYRQLAESIDSCFPYENYLFSLIAGIGLNMEQCDVIMNHVYDYFGKYENISVLCGKLTDCKIAVLLSLDHSVTVPEGYGENIVNYGHEKINVELAVSLTDIKAHPHFKRLYLDAENILAERLILGYGKIFMHRQITTTQKLLASAQNTVDLLLENPGLIDKDYYWTQLWSLMKQMNIGTLMSFYQYLTGILWSKSSDFQSAVSHWNIPGFYSFESLKQLEIFIQKLFQTYASYISNQKIESSIDLIKKYIDAHFSENLTLSDVAEHFFISYSYLSKVFHDTFGISFQSYIISKRMVYAEKLLHNPDLSIQEIGTEVGYTNVFNFSRAFKNYYGMSPNHYRDSKHEQ